MMKGAIIKLKKIRDFNLRNEMSYYYELFWHYQMLRVQDLIEQFDLRVSLISMMRNTYDEYAFMKFSL